MCNIAGHAIARECAITAPLQSARPHLSCRRAWHGSPAQRRRSGLPPSGNPALDGNPRCHPCPASEPCSCPAWVLCLMCKSFCLLGPAICLIASLLKAFNLRSSMGLNCLIVRLPYKSHLQRLAATSVEMTVTRFAEGELTSSMLASVSASRARSALASRAASSSRCATSGSLATLLSSPCCLEAMALRRMRCSSPGPS